MFKFTVIMTSFFAFTTSFVANANTAKIQELSKHVPGELIIKFKDQANTPQSILFSASERKTFKSSGAKLYKFPSVVDLNKTIAELSAHPDVDFVEKNAIYELQATPNDERFSELFGLHNKGQTGGTVDADIDALEAWEETIGSRDILVGVIDTGIDYTHPDLADNYWTNPGESGLDAEGNDKATNGIDDDLNGYVDDFRGWDFINGDNDPLDGHGHGSHCAGTVGAVGNNGIGVAGVNWEVSLVGLKIFSDAGSTTTDAIIEAIEYSTRIGVDLTNNSWGGGPASEAMKAAIQEANDADILFVAAAGNNRSDNDARDFYPANYEIPNIISVAAIDHNDNLASFSNYGATTVDVAAPGVDILSTVPGNGYESYSGTSMAAPHVAGLVALIKSKFPEANAQQLKARIVNTGDKTNALSNKVGSGKRINAASALEIDEVAPSIPQDLTLVSSEISSVNISWSASGDDGEEGLASSYEIKISDSPINGDNWEDASSASISSFTTSTSELSAKVYGLSLNSTGYIAIKAVDNLGNLSAVSENLIYNTREVEVTYQNAADDLNDFEATDEPWGTEEFDGASVITESPNGKYENNQNLSLTMNAVDVVNPESFLMIRSSYDLETRFDRGFVEISVDNGETWSELAQHTGKSNWVENMYDLSSYLEGAESFKLRFRVTTDGSQTRDGWKIDSISIITAQ